MEQEMVELINLFLRKNDREDLDGGILLGYPTGIP